MLGICMPCEIRANEEHPCLLCDFDSMVANLCLAIVLMFSEADGGQPGCRFPWLAGILHATARLSLHPV